MRFRLLVLGWILPPSGSTIDRIAKGIQSLRPLARTSTSVYAVRQSLEEVMSLKLEAGIERSFIVADYILRQTELGVSDAFLSYCTPSIPGKSIPTIR